MRALARGLLAVAALSYATGLVALEHALLQNGGWPD
jgi:hypothetical protein